MKRNYDLLKFNSDNINEKSLDQIKEFYRRCKVLKENFYKLLHKWANDELKGKTIFLMFILYRLVILILKKNLLKNA